MKTSLDLPWSYPKFLKICSVKNEKRRGSSRLSPNGSKYALELLGEVSASYT